MSLSSKQKPKFVSRTNIFQIFSPYIELLHSEPVVIPTTLQRRILNDFDASHRGITRMKSHMRSYLYGPNMDKDIENIVEFCKGSAMAANAPHIYIVLGLKRTDKCSGYRLELLKKFSKIPTWNQNTYRNLIKLYRQHVSLLFNQT